jgi:hypothetical protein
MLYVHLIHTAAGLCRAREAAMLWRIWWRDLEPPSRRRRLRRLNVAHYLTIVEVQDWPTPDSFCGRSTYASNRLQNRRAAAADSFL